MQFLLMRQGTARPKKMQSSRGKKLLRTPPLPSMEEIKCQLHHPRKEAEPVPDEPCRNELVISRDTSRHFKVLRAHKLTAQHHSFLQHTIFYTLSFTQMAVFFRRFPFPPSPFSLEQGHVASVCQICSGSLLQRVPWPAASCFPPYKV